MVRRSSGVSFPCSSIAERMVRRRASSSTQWSRRSSPEPVPASLARKMVLPNGESISAGLKELLTTDVDWIGIDFDDEEGEIEGISLEEAVEEAFGEEAVAAFAEAYELLSEDVVYFNG